jgi:hypothetical protein
MKVESFELTLEQKFEIERIKMAANLAPKEELEIMLIELVKQLMIKNNLLKDLMHKVL